MGNIFCLHILSVLSVQLQQVVVLKRGVMSQATCWSCNFLKSSLVGWQTATSRRWEVQEVTAVDQ